MATQKIILTLSNQDDDPEDIQISIDVEDHSAATTEAEMILSETTRYIGKDIADMLVGKHTDDDAIESDAPAAA